MSDLISRQAAIDALGERPMVWVGSDYELGARNQYDGDVLALEKLPSAQPKSYREGYQAGFNEGYQAGFKDAQLERKRGRWISYRCDMYECSKCGYIYTELTDRHKCGANYCPNCGLAMGGEQDE